MLLLAACVQLKASGLPFLPSPHTTETLRIRRDWFLHRARPRSPAANWGRGFGQRSCKNHAKWSRLDAPPFAWNSFQEAYRWPMVTSSLWPYAVNAAERGLQKPFADLHERRSVACSVNQSQRAHHVMYVMWDFTRLHAFPPSFSSVLGNLSEVEGDRQLPLCNRSELNGAQKYLCNPRGAKQRQATMILTTV